MIGFSVYLYEGAGISKIIYTSHPCLFNYRKQKSIPQSITGLRDFHLRRVYILQ